MDAKISQVKLDEQLARLRARDAIMRYHGWNLEVDGLAVFVKMYPKFAQPKTYLARFNFDDFPQRAPSLTFVDSQTKQEGKEFWPQHGAFNSAVNRQPPALCIAGIREFHEQLHREQSWDIDKYPFIKTLEAVQAELDKGYPAG